MKRFIYGVKLIASFVLPCLVFLMAGAYLARAAVQP